MGKRRGRNEPNPVDCLAHTLRDWHRGVPVELADAMEKIAKALTRVAEKSDLGAPHPNETASAYVVKATLEGDGWTQTRLYRPEGLDDMVKLAAAIKDRWAMEERR